jgi:DNA-binding winged helix-turn-helix (wHTH) protein
MGNATRSSWSNAFSVAPYSHPESTKEQTMACDTSLNLSQIAGPQPAHVTDVLQGASELFALAMPAAGDAEAAYPQSPLPGTLRQVFQSEGMPVLITFSKGESFTAGFRSQPVSTSVRALVVSLTWDDLVTRVTSLANRSESNLADTIRFADVCIDFASMEVRRKAGKPIPMTAQEFKALKFFVSNPGRVISRDELLNKAWGYDNYPSTRTVDNHVLKLRQKLELDPSRPRHFLTVHSMGYKFLP